MAVRSGNVLHSRWLEFRDEHFRRTNSGVSLSAARLTSPCQLFGDWHLLLDRLLCHPASSFVGSHGTVPRLRAFLSSWNLVGRSTQTLRLSETKLPNHGLRHIWTRQSRRSRCATPVPLGVNLSRQVSPRPRPLRSQARPSVIPRRVGPRLEGVVDAISPRPWNLHQTCKTSPSRATNSYRTGLTKKPRRSLEIRPATITIAKGFCVSEPMPVESAAGSNPRQATSAVIMMGRSRKREASRVAVRMSLFSSRSLLINETRMTAVSTDTPIRARSPRIDETLNGVWVSFSAMSAPTGSVITTPR